MLDTNIYINNKHRSILKEK